MVGEGGRRGGVAAALGGKFSAFGSGPSVWGGRPVVKSLAGKQTYAAASRLQFGVLPRTSAFTPPTVSLVPFVGLDPTRAPTKHCVRVAVCRGTGGQESVERGGGGCSWRSRKLFSSFLEPAFWGALFRSVCFREGLCGKKKGGGGGSISRGYTYILR